MTRELIHFPPNVCEITFTIVERVIAIIVEKFQVHVKWSKLTPVRYESIDSVFFV